MTPTYRYLTRTVRVAGLPFWQWLQIAGALVCAYGLSKLLAHVMPATWALSTAITIAGIPVAAAIVAMQAEFDVVALTRAAIAWRRSPKLLLPGTSPTADIRGYVLTARDHDARGRGRSEISLTPTDLEALWDRS